MPSLLPALAVACMAVVAMAETDTLSFEAKQNATADYINKMCYPVLMGKGTEFVTLEELENSPFPCDQEYYLSTICFPHTSDTDISDYTIPLEQTCLCNGNYFHAYSGCMSCRGAHGYDARVIKAGKEDVLSYSRLVCDVATPTRSYYEIRMSPLHSATPQSFALGPDTLFPSDTRVENYWTGAPKAVIGREGEKYAYTLEMPVTTPAPTGLQGEGGPAETATAPESATSSAGAGSVRAAGGMLALAIGVVVVM